MSEMVGGHSFGQGLPAVKAHRGMDQRVPKGVREETAPLLYLCTAEVKEAEQNVRN